MRLDTMTRIMLGDKNLSEAHVYVLSAVAGEIGNNSFDHNIGNWPDVAGIFFGYDVSGSNTRIILADRGVGILATLKKIKGELESDQQALETAFTERISGRSPERRGNGLKFVRESVSRDHLHLSFWSGDAQAELNDKIVIGKSHKNVRGCFAELKYSVMQNRA